MTVSFTGKGSWFGGPSDSMDSGKTALGLTTATPGVAIRPGATYMSGKPYLGGYWRITAPNGRSAILRQTDIGPNESTGRRVDVTYSALKQLGYTQNNFPTDGQFKAEYLGKTKPTGATVRSVSPRGGSGSTVVTTPGVDNRGVRSAAVAQWLLSKDSDPVALATQLIALRDTPGSSTSVPSLAGTTPAGSTPAGSSGENPLVATARSRANQIDAQKLPYSWGGGHQSKITNYRNTTPLDCSGAVSAVLGINPRVSGQFEKFGSPGRAPGGKGITIYANAKHVLMEIDGHFWGTSASNPGGGAGWIPRSAVPPGYLARFTARHLAASTR